MDLIEDKDNAKQLSQDIKDMVKQRLKTISEKNTKNDESIEKLTPVNVPLSLYSDEEMESGVVKALEGDNEKLKEINPEVNDDVNKRLYRTDRTKNTDSELSEGEIVDDDEDEEIPLNIVQKSENSAKSPEKVKNLIKSNEFHSNDHLTPRTAKNFHKNHQTFDLRQRIQTNRGKFRENMRGTNFRINDRTNARFKGRLKRSRSRSRNRCGSKEDLKSRKMKSPTKDKILHKNKLLTEIHGSKAAKKCENSKSLKEKLKLGSSLELLSSLKVSKHKSEKKETHKSHKHLKKKEKKLEKRSKETLSLDTVTEDSIKQLELKVEGLRAELLEVKDEIDPNIDNCEPLHLNVSHMSRSPCTPEGTPNKLIDKVKKETTPILLKEEPTQQITEKQTHDKKHKSKSPIRHEKHKFHKPLSSEKPKNEKDTKEHGERKRTRSKTPIKSVNNTHHGKQKSSIDSKKEQNSSEKDRSKNANENKKRLEPDKHCFINMNDGSIREIPLALVNHTTSLPKIIYCPRSNLNSSSIEVKSNSKTESLSIPTVLAHNSEFKDISNPKENHDKTKEQKSKEFLDSDKNETSNKKHKNSIKSPEHKHISGEKKDSDDTKKSKSQRSDSPKRNEKSAPKRRHSRSKSRNRSAHSTEKTSESKNKKERKKSPIKTDNHSHRTLDKTGTIDHEKLHCHRSRDKTHKQTCKDFTNKSKDIKNIVSSSRKDADKGPEKYDVHEERKSSAHQSEKRSESRKSREKVLIKSKSVDRKKADELRKHNARSENHTNEHKADKNKNDPLRNKSDLKDSKNSNKHRERTLSNKFERENQDKIQESSPKPSKSTSKTKVKQEHKPTLSFADELPEVQGLKPAEDETIFYTESKHNLFAYKSDPCMSKPAVLIDQVKSESFDQVSRKKKTEHAEMLKKIESNVEEILAPLSEIEKLALDRKSLKPEDLFNKMMDLFTPDKMNTETCEIKYEKHESTKEDPKVLLYDPVDTNIIDEKFSGLESVTNTIELPEIVDVVSKDIKLESEYETFINSLPLEGKPEEGSASLLMEHDTINVKPKKKESRSLSQSTSSSHTSGTTTSSTNNSSSESSSSTDSDSSDSSSSDSDSDSDSSNKNEEEKNISLKKLEVNEVETEVVSPSQTPPRQLMPLKIETTVSSTTITQEPELAPLPENRETPIKIQMNFVPKVCNINKHLNENEVPVFETDLQNEEVKEVIKEKSPIVDKKKVEDRKEKSSKERDKRRRSRSSSRNRSSESKPSSAYNRSRRSKERERKRRSRSRDRRHGRQVSRGQSRDRTKRRRSSMSPIRSHRRSKERILRRSSSNSPKRRSRRSSPRHHRPRSPRTPDSPRNSTRLRSPRFSRSRSCSRSPYRQNTWNRYDTYRRPPSPQNDTESPVAGFKRSLADSTISDAELEQQQLYKIQTHMTTEGFYSYMDNDINPAMPSNEMHDSPRRLSLDDRINIALGQNQNAEATKYTYPVNDEYPYNSYSNSGSQIPFQSHQPQQLQYRYDPAVYNAPSTGYDQNMSQYRYNYQAPLHNNQHPPHNSLPPRIGYNRELHMMSYQSRKMKPMQHIPSMPNQGGVIQKGNVLEIVPAVVELGQTQTDQEVTQAQADQSGLVKKKLIFTAEELQLRKEKKLELRKKRKADRDKKRLEKKMRKEKLKLEIKRLVSMGVKDEILSSEEDDAPFDDIDKKGIYGTKDRGILKSNKSETALPKKSVKFADGVLPGYGSSSDNEQKPESSPSLLNVRGKRKKKIPKLKKNQNNESTEKKTIEELVSFPVETNVPPELEHAQPPPPPEGNPPSDLQQPRYLYPNRVPMLFFHLLRPSYQQPPHPLHLLPGHPGFNNAHPSPHQSPALYLNSQQQPLNKFTPSSRVNQLPPNFGVNKNPIT